LCSRPLFGKGWARPSPTHLVTSSAARICNHNKISIRRSFTSTWCRGQECRSYTSASLYLEGTVPNELGTGWFNNSSITAAVVRAEQFCISPVQICGCTGSETNLNSIVQSIPSPFQKNSIWKEIIAANQKRELCKIWGFHGGDSEEWCLLGCYAVWLLEESTFRRNLAPPSSWWQESVN
jgi:hypothetical protein